MSNRDGDLTIGGFNDEVALTINGNKLAITEGYEIKISVMTQPAAFSLRLGHAGIAKELLELCPKGARFQLSIGGIVQQSGIIDSRSVPSSDSTVVEIKGRDYMRKLFNGHVEEDIELTERTYYDLTRKVMDLVGLSEHKLVAGNGANRQAVTAVKVPVVKTEDQVRTLSTGMGFSGGSRMEFKALKAKVGQRWYDWLQDKYKLVGLFLWCAGDGSFVLATPQPNVTPSVVLVRQRGVARNTVNIETHSWQDDATNRHAKYIVYGSEGGGKGGRNKIRGEYIDPEMVEAGLLDVITYYDDDVKNDKEAEYLARKYASEERRSGWELSYTVGGHRTPSLINDGIAVWGPDTAAKVIDEELGIEGPRYIESVTYSCNDKSLTRLELIRPEDLLYLADEDQSAKTKKADAYKAALAKKTPVAAAAEATETDWTQWTWERDGDAPVAASTDSTSILYSQS
jgi:prophage tail gpP-like protein